MEPNQNLQQNSEPSTKTSAKDFFLNLGTMAALYTIVISLLNLLFRVINVAFPQTLDSYSYYEGSSISFPVATLIIFSPIFVLLMWSLEKIYAIEPEKKHLIIKRWLTYITLFVAGTVLAGDLVVVLYYFIDGQELTAGFLMKVFAVLLVALSVFMYYISDIREKLTKVSQRVWAGITLAVILTSIVLGFTVLGSPGTQRLIKYDNQKISDLQNLQWQIMNYWQTYGMIPEGWTNMMTDHQTQKPYEYKKTGDLNFELCAEFNHKSMMNQKQSLTLMQTEYPTKEGVMRNDNWEHGVGKKCFEKIIDPNKDIKGNL